MTIVNFYLHKAKAAVLDTTCLLLRHLWHAKETTYVYVPDASLAKTLDEVMWIFEPQAFVPHRLYEDSNQGAAQAPIYIGTKEPPEALCSALINLSGRQVGAWHRFKKIYEIVAADEQAINQGRALYKQYKTAGCEMYHHRIDRIRSHYFKSVSAEQTTAHP